MYSTHQNDTHQKHKTSQLACSNQKASRRRTGRGTGLQPVDGVVVFADFCIFLFSHFMLLSISMARRIRHTKKQKKTAKKTAKKGLIAIQRSILELNTNLVLSFNSEVGKSNQVPLVTIMTGSSLPVVADRRNKSNLQLTRIILSCNLGGRIIYVTFQVVSLAYKRLFITLVMGRSAGLFLTLAY